MAVKPLDVDGLTALLQSAHAMLAGITKTPELAFSKEEAQQMSAAYANVARHYQWNVAEKTVDWTNLLMCVGAIYGSKFMAIKLRKDGEKPKREAKAPPPQTAPVSGPVSVTNPINTRPQAARTAQDYIPPAAPDPAEEGHY